ncbi:MAG: hypothetical protein ACQBVK_04175 [Candidatus Phytoplasma sp. TWB_XP]
MLSFSNTDGAGASKTVAAGSFFANGSTGYAMSVFCPTARNLATGGAGVNVFTDKCDRTSSTCFMRGYKENVRVQTSSPLPWLWRRITFVTKSDAFIGRAPADAAPTQEVQPYSDTSVGMARKWFNLQVNNTPRTVEFYNASIFKGTFNRDWNDVITAKVDTARITVRSDVTRRITTGNGAGHFSERKLWYPMNKNLVYDDDENGAAMDSSYYSTQSKAGQGDYFIVDYLVPGVGGTSSDIININCSATLYWHEK